MKKLSIATILITVVCAAGSFLLAASVLAEEHDGSNIVSDASLQLQGKPEGRPQRFGNNSHRRVHCDRGHSLARALKRARAGDTVTFSGVCYESVVIRRDNVTLLGTGGAAIDGSQMPSEAVVLLDGARNVTLRGFAVQNGADQGILATHQTQAILQDLTIQGSGTVGLSVDRSHLELIDINLDNNGTGGMDAYSASTVLVKGLLSAVGNGGDGLAVNGKTFFELRGAQVTASQNLGSGVSIINDSRMQIFSFPEAQGSGVNADNNGFAGIGILGSEVSVVGSQFQGSGANVISARDNFVFGFFMPAGSIISPHATAKFVASGSGVGMLLEDNANVLIIGGLDLSENGAGLSAHGAGTLTIVSIPPNPSRISGNGIDVDVGFGTRMTASALEFDSVACDETVLTRGIECP